MAVKKNDSLFTEIHEFGLNVKTREIYLHPRTDSTDEGEPGVEYGMASRFEKNLHILDQPPNKPIVIHMHTVGGIWDDGMGIFNAIQFASSHVTILAYAHARSMSSIIFQAADVRVMMPDCYFLMHHGKSGIDENHPFAVKSIADYEAKCCQRMMKIYAEKAIKGPYFSKRKATTMATVISFIDKKLKTHVDWYLDAEEAVWYGFADAVLGGKQYPTIESLRIEG
jgi:ATP-dependent protease ClpP protease subunit